VGGGGSVLHCVVLNTPIRHSTEVGNTSENSLQNSGD
jgi:hypothetical protein